MSGAEAVRRYFDGEAERFDAIYRADKSVAQRIVDQLFRGVMRRRYQMTLALCGDVEGKRVLDVGCGSGRYAVEFARRGAQVVGLDFAPAMVEMAARRADQAGVGEQCRFEAGDFLEWREPHHFDICLGIGFFDYTAEPRDFLGRLRQLTEERGVFSFPIRWTMRSLTRWMRLSLNRCPVYFYDGNQVTGLLSQSGWSQIEVERLSRDFLVHAR